MTKFRSREVRLQTPEREQPQASILANSSSCEKKQTVQRAHIVPTFKVPIVLILAFFVRDLCKPKGGYCLTFSHENMSIEYLIGREVL